MYKSELLKFLLYHDLECYQKPRLKLAHGLACPLCPGEELRALMRVVIFAV